MEICTRLVLNNLSVQTQLFVFFPNEFSKSHNFSSSRKFFTGGSSRHSLCSHMPATHHVRGKNENTLVFSTGPLRIIQEIWIILCSFPSFTSWGNKERTLGHKIQSFKLPVSSLKKSFQTANMKSVGRSHSTGKLQLQSSVCMSSMHQLDSRTLEKPHKLFLQHVPDRLF